MGVLGARGISEHTWEEAAKKNFLVEQSGTVEMAESFRGLRLKIFEMAESADRWEGMGAEGK